MMWSRREGRGVREARAVGEEKEKEGIEIEYKNTESRAAEDGK